MDAILSRISRYIDRLVERGYHKFALHLVTGPFFLLFVLAGAAMGPAFGAGMGVGIILLLPRFMDEANTPRERRMPLLAGGALLSFAAGVQTIIWLRGPVSEETS